MGEQIQTWVVWPKMIGEWEPDCWQAGARLYREPQVLRCVWRLDNRTRQPWRTSAEPP